jgi:hypothetical protein
MSNKILIIKTGNTIPSLLAENEDFEDWFIRGTGLDSSRFVCCAVDKGESLPAIDDVAAAIVTGSPAYVTDLAPWNLLERLRAICCLTKCRSNSAHRLHMSSQSYPCRMRQCFSQKIALMHIMHSAWVHRLEGYSFILNLARM